MTDAGSPAYFAPAFRIKVGESPLTPEQERSVAELTVTHEIGASDQFRIVLVNPYPTLPWTHGKDAALFWPGVDVTIAMGYVNQTVPLFSGEVTALTANFPPDGASTLRVDGLSRLYWLDGPRRTQTFKDVTDAGVAEAIARGVSLSSKAELTDIKYPYVIQNNQTDLEFLRNRADAIDYELLVADKTLIFRKSKAGAAKRISLKWGETLRRFEPTLDSLQPVTGVTVRGYDPKTKAEIVGSAAVGAQETTMGRQSGAELVQAAFGSRTETMTHLQPGSQAEADQRAKAIFNRRMMQLITGAGVSVGDPSLRAGVVAEITGLGASFSGLYYIVSSTHSFGAGGYETQFSVRKNALS